MRYRNIIAVLFLGVFLSGCASRLYDSQHAAGWLHYHYGVKVTGKPRCQNGDPVHPELFMYNNTRFSNMEISINGHDVVIPCPDGSVLRAFDMGSRLSVSNGDVKVVTACVQRMCVDKRVSWQQSNLLSQSSYSGLYANRSDIGMHAVVEFVDDDFARKYPDRFAIAKRELEDKLEAAKKGAERKK